MLTEQAQISFANRPTLEQVTEQFKKVFGPTGKQIYRDFITSSHKYVHNPGAPISNFIAEYFLRHALDHPGSTEEHDYNALNFYKHLEPPQEITREELNQATGRYIQTLKLLQDPMMQYLFFDLQKRFENDFELPAETVASLSKKTQLANAKQPSFSFLIDLIKIRQYTPSSALTQAVLNRAQISLVNQDVIISDKELLQMIDHISNQIKRKSIFPKMVNPAFEQAISA